MRRLACLAAAAALFASTRAHAAGFEIYDQSPTGMGMANAVTAKADDPSAVFYNPAGMAMMPGGGAMLSGTIALISFQSVSSSMPQVTTDSQNGTFFLPQFYAFQHLGDRFAIGVGGFPMFGTGVDWKANGTTSDGMSVPFPGRFLASNSQITTYMINPSIAFKPIDRFSLALGFDAELASVELDRSIQIADAEAQAKLGGTATGFGMNFGVLVEIIKDRLWGGFHYRSAIDLDFGPDHFKAHFDGPPELASVLYDQPAHTSFKTPHNFSLGLATKPMPNLTITTDVHVELWSEFSKLAVDFPSMGSMTPGFSAVENWKDSVAVWIGAEYILLHALAIRLGFGYDFAAVPTETLGPTLPETDRVVVSVGLGYSWRGLSVDAAYIAGISTGDRTSTDPEFLATYSNKLNAIGVGVSYRWGRK